MTIECTQTIDYLYHAKYDTLLTLISSNYNIQSLNQGSVFKMLVKSFIPYHNHMIKINNMNDNIEHNTNFGMDAK